MSETLSIRVPAQEKEEWEKAAAAVDESVAEYVRKAVRQRAHSSAKSPWEKFFGKADVLISPPTNANVRRAFKKGRQKK